jgi:hypothetical protein
MRELLEAHGLLDAPQGPVMIPELEAEDRRSTSQTDSAFTFSMSSGRNEWRERRLERNTERLKRLSESSLPSRAIMLIRNGISGLTYGLQPRSNVPLDERDSFRKETDIIRDIIEHPNPEDDDFYTFIGQIVEDLLCFDAGVWEYVEHPSFIEKNDIIAMFPVPGHTIAKNIRWKGDPDKIRWQQTVGNENKFKDSQIEYLMQRKRSFTPFGYSPLEVTIEIMDSWLNLTSYQRQVASNAYPRTMFYLGDDTTHDQALVMRAYWASELEGKGRPGIWGNTGKPEAIDLKPAGDEGLYLKYQEMLVRTLAFTFGLKPQDFGLERDVNRSTSVVSQIASVEEARKPIARLIASKLNARLIPRVAQLTNNPKISLMEFFWIGMDPRQEKIDAEINEIYLKRDVKTIDDVRQELDLAPLPGGLGKFPPSVLKEMAKTNSEQILALMRGDSTGGTVPQLQVVTEPNDDGLSVAASRSPRGFRRI